LEDCIHRFCFLKIERLIRCAQANFFPGMLPRDSTLDPVSEDLPEAGAAGGDDDVAAGGVASADVSKDESATSKPKGNVSQLELAVSLYGTPERKNAEPGDSGKGGEAGHDVLKTLREPVFSEGGFF
jgi:hypothetical protein